MGSIRKRNGKYQAQVRRDGVPAISKTFRTKRDAIVWVRGLEARIDAGEVNITMPKLVTLGDILKRYGQEITPLKKGREQETRRINRLLRDPIADFKLSQLTSGVIAQFRDQRVNDGVRAAQIDLILIRHALKIGRLEWEIPLASNPVDNIRIPNGIKRRERRLREGEYEALREAAQHCKNKYIWPTVEFAIETAMRRSEILSLLWENIDFKSTLATLPDTKSGIMRKVPLTRYAVSILQNLPKHSFRPFEVPNYSIRHGWDRLVGHAGIVDLRFHDLRHEAVSRFFEMGLSIPEVASISGHKDYRMLASYAHLKGESLSKKLRSKRPH